MPKEPPVQSILLVDDRPENLLALEKILERPGIDIIKAYSGNEALGLLLEHDFALILLDVMMPEMDGFETAELIRGNSETKHIPIIFVTAISKEQQHVFKGYESGAVDYLFKPLNPDILIGKVNVFLELHRQKSELKAVNHQLHKARLEAEVASRAKSNFLNRLSHELRTPLNGVIGMTGLLLDTDLAKKQREFVETVRGSADKLLTVINDILDFSQIDVGGLDLETLDFNLRTTLEDAGDIIGIRAHEKGLEFICLIEPDVPSLVRGDPGRLRQILSYLTDNAIKYTPEGEISLHVSTQSENDSRAVIRFEISDTGIGIPEEQQPYLFDAFSQVDRKTSGDPGGTGLGLTISRDLIEMMDGEIGMSSIEGEGSTFWFTIRLEKQAAVHLPEPVGDGGISGIRVLVVDDNATNRRLLALLLDSWDCRYDEATEGETALQMLNEAADIGDPFHIAVLDMQMPGMDGETLGAKIKDIPKLSDTRLVMMTSTGRRGDAGRLQKIGFDAYLPKPVKQGLLYDCLVTVYSGNGVLPEEDKHRLVTRHSIAEARRQKVRILVVEDNVTIQKAILDTLIKLGCRADAVANGKEAVQALEDIPYDLVLMDTKMPVMNGYEAAKEIRVIEQRQRDDHSRKSRLRGVPIIAMTGNEMDKYREELAAVGIDDAIPKPVIPLNLVTVIEKWLAEPKVAQPKQAVVFDKEGLLERVMEDEELVRELIDEFLKEIPERLSDLEKALAQPDYQQIRSQGHTIKGTSGNMGAIALQKVAARLEAAGQADDLETAASLIQQLQHQFKQFRSEALHNLKPGLNSSGE